MTFEVPRRLERDDDTADFTSAATELDQWLRRYAWENQRANNAVTYVTTAEKPLVVGYYSITTAGIAKSEAPARLQHMSRPQELGMLLIGRLAVDHRFQGRGLGAGLLADALERSVQLSEAVGVVGVLIHCRDEAAKEFYLANGDFVECPLDPMQMLVMMKDLHPTYTASSARASCSKSASHSLTLM